MKQKKTMIAALLLATSTAAHAGYRDTWHGGIVGVDICYAVRGPASDLDSLRLIGAAIPCLSMR